jgi:hypothetical protein
MHKGWGERIIVSLSDPELDQFMIQKYGEGYWTIPATRKPDICVRYFGDTELEPMNADNSEG